VVRRGAGAGGGQWGRGAAPPRREPGAGHALLLYNFATAFVFPSLAEGFGLPLAEAMACGTVVIASSTEIFREVGGDVPIFFDPVDTGSLVQAIELAASGEKRARRVGEGLERAQSFSWDRSAEAFHRVYASVGRVIGWAPGCVGTGSPHVRAVDARVRDA
jgi:glycosyltransferase involved in cell wall biosynthesis